MSDESMMETTKY